MTATDLREKILAALAERPRTFAQLEATVGRQDDFALGIALSRLLIAKAIKKHCTNTSHYWPVYHIDPMPKSWRAPRRNP